MFLSVWNGDRQAFIRGRLSNENNFEQKLLPLTLSQRKLFKSYEIIIVVINEIIKRPVYMSENYGTEKKLRVKATSSHFTQPGSIPAFLFAFQRVYSPFFQYLSFGTDLWEK